jgi:hypothetical protein
VSQATSKAEENQESLGLLFEGRRFPIVRFCTQDSAGDLRGSIRRDPYEEHGAFDEAGLRYLVCTS